MKKYVCIGGNVISKTDGDEHRIFPHRLAELYKVNPNECYFVKDDNDPSIMGLRIEELIVLRPRYDGRYDLIQTQKNKE